MAEEFARDYAGAVNPRFYAQLLDEFCKSHQGLCTHSDPETSIGNRREKRAAGMLIVGGIFILMTIINTILSSVNTHRIRQLTQEVDAVIEMVNRLTGAMNLIQKSVIELSKNGKKITRMVTEGLKEIYTLVEKLRCADFHELESVQYYTALQIYRQYLTTTFSSIHEASITGKITPHLIGVPEVKQILSAHSILRHSILMDEPSLFYRYVTAFPVRLNFQTMTFGFVLQIPNLDEKDIMPLYRIYNVGFHMPIPYNDPDYAVKRELVYKAPLPKYVILKKNQELIPLDPEKCEQAPGLLYCEDGAITLSEPPSSCVDLFVKADCNDCEYTKRCRDDIYISGTENRNTRVRATSAGVLIRSATSSIKLFEAGIGVGVRGTTIPQSKHGTYWLSYQNVSQFMVGNILYTSRGSDFHTTKVFDPPLINQSQAEIKHTLSSLRHLSGIIKGEKKIYELLNQIDLPETMYDRKEYKISVLILAILGSIAGLIAITLVGCCCGGCLDCVSLQHRLLHSGRTPRKANVQRPCGNSKNQLSSLPFEAPKGIHATPHGHFSKQSPESITFPVTIRQINEEPFGANVRMIEGSALSPANSVISRKNTKQNFRTPPPYSYRNSQRIISKPTPKSVIIPGNNDPKNLVHLDANPMESFDKTPIEYSVRTPQVIYSRRASVDQAKNTPNLSLIE
jgi:hypothetical protein